MAIRDIEVKISELNPLRYAQSDKIDLNYPTANFQNTLFSTNANTFKYVQPFGIDDVLRSQVATYGEEVADSYISIFAELYDANDNLISDLSLTEKEGDWNNGDLKLYEFEYTLATAGQYYVKITVDSYPLPGDEGELITKYFYSETFIVDGVYNCLPKLIYSDSRNYPTYDMYFATETKYQMRVELGMNQLPQVDVTGYEDNVRDFKNLHSSFYYRYDIFTTNVVPVWIAAKTKFALGLDYCYLNFEPFSLIGNDEIELIEDGLNACTFKFKAQPNKQLLSISADDFSVTGETYKDFTNITCNPSIGSGTCSPWAPSCAGDAVQSVTSTDNHIVVNNTDPFNPTLSWQLVDNENLLTDAEKAALHSHSNKTALDAVSGTNTGDQDLDGYLLKNTDLQTAETPTDTSLFSWWNGTSRVKSTILSLKQYFKGWFATQNPGICAITPVLPTDIDINYEAWTLTVARVKGVAISANNPLIFFTDGDGEITKHVKTAPIEFQFANTTTLWYFYFDANGDPITTVTPWTDFSIISPIYRLKWQAGTAPTSTLNAISELYECHQNTMTWVDHLHAHLGGTVWVSGYDITNNATTGVPNADGRNTVVSLTSGTVLDDNLFFTCTNSTSSAMLNQDLGELSAAALNATNSAIFPIRYKGATSAIVEAGTRFPFLFETATNSNRPEYVNASGFRTLVSNGYYFVYFAYTIQDRRNGQTIRITPAYAQYNTETLAQAVTWETIQAQDSDANDTEIRPLYKMIFLYRSSYNIGCKYTALRSVEDIRKSKITSVSNVGGSINEASVITSARTNLTGTNLATNLAIIDENIIFPHNTISHTTGLLNLNTQSETTISDVWTSANTGLVITPLKPSANLKSADTILNFSVGASLPTITWTPDTGITPKWRRTENIPWATNKSYTFHFIWISATRCDVTYTIY